MSTTPSAPVAGHTPGPRYRPSITVSNECKIFDGDMLVATVVNDHGGDLTKEDCDRADFIVAALNSRQLIAAAPELLEALQKITARWPVTTDPNCDDYTRGYAQAVADLVLGIARPAISKVQP